jgi:Pex19 protein family
MVFSSGVIYMYEHSSLSSFRSNAPKFAHMMFRHRRRLAQQLQGLGGGEASDPEEMDAMVGVILKQLLSKQVLHQSMKVPDLPVLRCSCLHCTRCLIHDTSTLA